MRELMNFEVYLHFCQMDIREMSGMRKELKKSNITINVPNI